VWPVNRVCLFPLGAWPHTPLLFAEVRASPIFTGIVLFTWFRYRFGLRIFCLLDWTLWFWQWVVLFPWSRHTYFDYWILRLKWGTQRMWPVDGCLLLDAWSYVWFLQGSVFAQFSGFIFHKGFMSLITVRYITFFILMGKKDDSLVSKTAIYIN
jgi:hypothetical protein